MKRTILLALALSCVGIGTARAQQDVTASARAHFTAGQAHVAAERYGAAYAEFSAGFELSQRPLFLFNMAECAYHDGQRERARREYERYLAADPNGAMAGTARERLEELGPAPLQLSPAHVAAASQPHPALTVAPVARPAAREIWQEEAFWGVLGASVGAVLIAVITGIAVASTSSGPACGAGCTLVDFR